MDVPNLQILLCLDRILFRYVKVIPCSSPHGYLSTSTPRRWPTSTLGHVGWWPVEPHRCFGFDSERCRIWHRICISGTWNNAWYNVIWIDMIYDFICSSMSHKMKYWGSWRLPHLQFCSWGKQCVCVFSTQELLLFPWTANSSHQHVFPQLHTFQQEDLKQSPIDGVKSTGPVEQTWRHRTYWNSQLRHLWFAENDGSSIAKGIRNILLPWVPFSYKKHPHDRSGKE